MSSDPVSRKSFVAAIGALGTAAAAHAAPADAATAPAGVAAHHTPASHRAKHPAALKPLGANPEAYIFFTEPEVAFMEAAVERIIPTDELSPGALQAGCVYFIDQQLEGQFGYAAKMYKQGPWAPGLPTQGYQLPLTPREVYRLGIAATNAHCQSAYRRRFDKLSSRQQDAVLTGLEKGTIAFEAFPAPTFFAMLSSNTIEGYFSDPVYGGNRDKIGWKLLGFPGVAAAYIGNIEDHNKPYHATPTGIADVERAVGMMDEDARMMNAMASNGEGR